MRTNLTNSPADHIVVVGTGEAAMAALWRLCAAGARIRWFVDRADVGEETVLAHALGGGRVELTFDDPRSASLDGAAAIVIAGANSRHVGLSERARANGVAVHLVGCPGLSVDPLAEPQGAPRAV
jgi:siroheme synthase (precorrin-2 oxidase/ferrochelatase)